MNYFISFLEGIITFISPCLLPMLPIYISFFAGEGSNKKNMKALPNALAFVLGFTLVFVTLGAFAGTIGALLLSHKSVVNIISGLIVIVFGLNFMDFIHIPLLNRTKGLSHDGKSGSLLSSFSFGIIFSIGWTPCVGAFLGSALMMASNQGSTGQGILMLLFYSLGLGIPFVLSALFIGYLMNTLNWIKAHYTIINRISGLFLVIVGIFMMTGMLDRFIALFTF